jgi:phage tail-like protein
MSFSYLNRENLWPGFAWRGLALGEDGALHLLAVPLLSPAAPGLDALPAPDGPAGVAVDAAGAVFYTDPGADLLWRIDPCDGARAPVPCCGGTGGLPTQLRSPRGLLLHPRLGGPGGALLVADSGNHRIQILDPASLALIGIWGQADPAAPPRPGAAAGRLDTPWSLAADPAGAVYVVDHGNRRVQKFAPRGRVDAAFWERAAAAGMVQPTAVAVLAGAAGAEVLVLDRDGAAGRVLAFDPEGLLRRRFDLPPGDPLVLAAAGGAILVGDNLRRRLLVLTPDGAPIGEAEGFSGPVAALAAGAASTGAGTSDTAGAGAGGAGDLWLHPGGAAAPRRLSAGGGHARSGVLWGGPFGSGAQPVLWHQVKAFGDALGDPLSPGSHLQLFFATADSPAGGPPDPTGPPLTPFATPPWQPLPPDATRGLVRGAPARYLWLGAHLTGEGRETPCLAQLRIDFDPETYSAHLPVIYRAKAPDPELLERFLALFESGFADVEAEIAGLGRHFDVAATPASWLPWLAGWLGLELEETWSAERRRRALAGAFAADGRRGTVAGLQEALRFATGVEARIAEPILHARWWALPPADAAPGEGGLGFATVLAPADIDGAVVGTTAVLDGSYLTEDGEGPGAHLFAAAAHQFAVEVYERQVADPRQRERVLAVLDAEKPAHTAYRLCVIAPRLRVGFQARLGIDTVVAGPAAARRLGDAAELVLGGELPGRIGQADRIGIGTRLGEAGLASGAI